MQNIYRVKTIAPALNGHFPLKNGKSIATQATKQSELILKNGIWIYFFLLIFEGALRKWVLPSLASPLLLIRDPIALYLVFTAVRNGFLTFNPYLTIIMIIGVISTFTALFLGHGSLPVALYGARIFLIQFPLIFVIGRVLNRADVMKFGKVILIITLPMTLIIGLQFFSPQTSFINRGIGGVETSGFQGANGHFRPPGTFSFITGTYLFYSLSFCFVLYYWLFSNRINRLLLIAATIGTLAAIPLSISRTLFFEVCGTVFFAFITVFQNPKYLKTFATTIIGTVIVVFILSQTQFFQNATETFFARFTDATGSEGGLQGTLGDRFLGGLVSAITGSFDLPFFGYGIGMGTNVGSQIMSGNTIFLLHEEEWGRIIDEIGPLFGLTVILIRVLVTAKISVASYRQIKQGDMLPWMLLSFGFLQLAQGNWAQPTSLGFCILIGGLIIASLNHSPVRRTS